MSSDLDCGVVHDEVASYLVRLNFFVPSHGSGVVEMDQYDVFKNCSLL